MIYILDLFNYLKYTEYKFNFKIFFVSTVFLFIFLLIRKTDIFYFDAYEYWELSKNFHETATIINYPLNIRGYLLPLIFSIFSQLNKNIHSNILFYLFQAILSSTIFLFFIPYFVKTFFNTLKLNLFFVFNTYIIFLFFWWRYLLSPLSDIPALLFFFSSIFFIKKSSKYLLLSGFFIYAAINIRPSYIFCLPLIIIYIFYIKRNNLEIKNIFSFILGFIILAIPELLINIFLKKTFSILPSSNFAYEGVSLGIWQLKVGIYTLRYETFVNIMLRNCYGVFQKNPLIQDPDSIIINSISEYFIYIFSNLKKFILSVISHCFSIVTPLSNSPYISDPMDLKIFPYVSALIWSISLSGIWNLKSHIKALRIVQIFGIILLTSPSYLSLFVGIESRFSITFHIAAYLLFAYLISINYKWYKEFLFYAILTLIIISFTLIMNKNLTSCLR